MKNALQSVNPTTLLMRLHKMHIRPLEIRRCNCRDKKFRLKKLYASPSDAEYSASMRVGIIRKALKIYECPERLGWHLTSNIF